MRTIRLHKQLTDEQSNSMLGGLLTEDFHRILIKEDTDAYDADTGEVIFKFRRGVIPAKVAAAAYHALRGAATPSMNRGTATEKLFGHKGHLPLRKSGKVSKTHEAVRPVDSGIVGYFDRYVRIPYCRTTAWTMKNFPKFNRAYPVIKLVDDQYRKLMPEHYARQREAADRTSPDFVIKDTAFTTITVNKNWQTAVHTDKGDYDKGFGNLVVLRAGRYDGGYFVVVPYRVAIDMNNLDLLMVNVHVPHGNTPIKKIDANAERLSLVMYYRQNMIFCGTREQELELAKNRTEGDAVIHVDLNPFNTSS